MAGLGRVLSSRIKRKFKEEEDLGSPGLPKGLPVSPTCLKSMPFSKEEVRNNTEPRPLKRGKRTEDTEGLEKRLTLNNNVKQVAQRVLEVPTKASDISVMAQQVTPLIEPYLDSHPQTQFLDFLKKPVEKTEVSKEDKNSLIYDKIIDLVRSQKTTDAIKIIDDRKINVYLINSSKRYFCKQTLDSFSTVIEHAAIQGNFEFIRYLLEIKKYDVSRKSLKISIIKNAILSKNENLLKYLRNLKKFRKFFSSFKYGIFYFAMQNGSRNILEKIFQEFFFDWRIKRIIDRLTPRGKDVVVLIGFRLLKKVFFELKRLKENKFFKNFLYLETLLNNKMEEVQFFLSKEIKVDLSKKPTLESGDHLENLKNAIEIIFYLKTFLEDIKKIEILDKEKIAVFNEIERPVLGLIKKLPVIDENIFTEEQQKKIVQIAIFSLNLDIIKFVFEKLEKRVQKGIGLVFREKDSFFRDIFERSVLNNKIKVFEYLETTFKFYKKNGYFFYKDIINWIANENISFETVKYLLDLDNASYSKIKMNLDNLELEMLIKRLITNNKLNIIEYMFSKKWFEQDFEVVKRLIDLSMKLEKPEIFNFLINLGTSFLKQKDRENYKKLNSLKK